MAKVTSRRLVVDADISSAAGREDAVDPRAKTCRDVLLAILVVCHRIVISRAMLEEWKRHRSTFAKRWLVQMMGRKKVDIESIGEDAGLRNRLSACADSDARRDAMLKDALLIEAALAADRIVLSLDETVRSLYVQAAATVAELKLIVWANPEQVEDAVIPWLEAGAPAERVRMLGEVR